MGMAGWPTKKEFGLSVQIASISGLAFGTGDRRVVEVIKLGAAMAAQTLGTKLWLCHALKSLGDEKGGGDWRTVCQ
jgi:hypothetical protein